MNLQNKIWTVTLLPNDVWCVFEGEDIPAKRSKFRWVSCNPSKDIALSEAQNIYRQLLKTTLAENLS